MRNTSEGAERRKERRKRERERETEIQEQAERMHRQGTWLPLLCTIAFLVHCPLLHVAIVTFADTM